MTNPIDPADQIAADMRALPEAARKPLRAKLRAAGEAVVSDAKARASWSTRIPDTVRLDISFRADREGVRIVAGGRNAPQARAYEGITTGKTYRHPVYPDSTHFTREKWHWVEAPTRPFLLPAAEAVEGPTTTAVENALSEAAVTIGFRG